MCGIAGVFHRDPQQPIDSQLLVNMAAIQYHRGPDNFGYANPPGLGLGLSHARLSIIDESGSKEFMPTNIRIPTVKLKIPGKLFFKVESRTSVTFKL